MENANSKFATRAVHAGQHPDHETGALVTPLYLTSTYVFTPDYNGTLAGRDTSQGPIYTYGRSRNPTQDAFQEKVASLESGEAALMTVQGWQQSHWQCWVLFILVTMLFHVRQSTGGTFALFTKIFEEFHIEVSFLPKMTNAALDAALKPNTKIIYLGPF